jgi:predicted RNase H-like HicB family nuclease
MKRATVRAKKKPDSRSSPKKLPVIIEEGEDGFYVVECPVLQGCYTQGKSIDEALRNIREVIELLLEEDEARAVLEDYQPTEISFHTINL